MYLPTLGRFTSVDRVPGGTANNYVYTLDPINSNDYSGNACYSWGCTLGGGSLGPSTNSTTRLQPAGNTVQAPAQYSQGGNLNPQTTVGGGVVQSSRSVGRRVVLAPSKPATPAAKARDNSTALPAARVDFTKLQKPAGAIYGQTLTAKPGPGYGSFGLGGSSVMWGMPVGVGGGVKVENGGKAHPFLNFGFSGPAGLDASIMTSSKKLSTGCGLNYSAGFWLGASGNQNGLQEAGLMTPGISVGIECVW